MTNNRFRTISENEEYIITCYSNSNEGDLNRAVVLIQNKVNHDLIIYKVEISDAGESGSERLNKFTDTIITFDEKKCITQEHSSNIKSPQYAGWFFTFYLRGSVLNLDSMFIPQILEYKNKPRDEFKVKSPFNAKEISEITNHFRKAGIEFESNESNLPQCLLDYIEKNIEI